MVLAWYMLEDESARDAGVHDNAEMVSLTHLSKLGVLYWYIETEDYQHNSTFVSICKTRKYVNSDTVTLNPETARAKSDVLDMFFEEHLHDDEEIRYILEGSGFFDVRELNSERWIRIWVQKNDLLILPPGVFHRFALDTKKTVKALRLFQTEPKWIAHNRSDDSSKRDARQQYINAVAASAKPNGIAFRLNDRAKAYANYPHARRVNGFIHVSGTSSRRPDNTHIGAIQNEQDGSFTLDIRLQTQAVLENIKWILQQCGADLHNLVAVTVFLMDFNDFAGFNEIYNRYFDSDTGPTRTTVAVSALPHPNLLIEIQAVAVDPNHTL